MRIFAWITTVTVAALASAGSAMATQADISFDGFCDGAHLTIRGDNIWLADKVSVAELPTGCVEGDGVGEGFKTKIKGIAGDTLQIGLNVIGAPGLEFTYLIEYPLVEGGAWSNFFTADGVTVTPLFTGTYSLGVPAAAAKGRRTTDWTGKAASARAKTFDISFDGFCDGAHLTIAKKVFVGHQPTGCEAGTGVGEGFIGRVTGKVGSQQLLIGANFGPGPAFTYIIEYPLVDGGAWSNYFTIDGKKVRRLNSGTYSLGAPAAVAKGRKSTAHR
jgi:hypothetical protein